MHLRKDQVWSASENILSGTERLNKYLNVDILFVLCIFYHAYGHGAYFYLSRKACLAESEPPEIIILGGHLEKTIDSQSIAIIAYRGRIGY